MQLLIGNILNYLLMKIKRSEQKTVIQLSGHLEFLMRRWVEKTTKEIITEKLSREQHLKTKKMSKHR